MAAIDWRAVLLRLQTIESQLIGKSFTIRELETLTGVPRWNWSHHYVLGHLAGTKSKGNRLHIKGDDVLKFARETVRFAVPPRDKNKRKRAAPQAKT